MQWGVVVALRACMCCSCSCRVACARVACTQAGLAAIARVACTQAGIAAIARCRQVLSIPNPMSITKPVVHTTLPVTLEHMAAFHTELKTLLESLTTPQHPELQTKARRGDNKCIPRGLWFGWQVGCTRSSWTFSVGGIVAECVCAWQPRQDVWRRCFKYWKRGLGTQHRLFDQSINQIFYTLITNTNTLS